MKIDEIYYLILGKILDEGLKRVYDDKEVLEMVDIVVANRFIDLYVVHGVDKEKFVPLISASGQETPKKKVQQPLMRKLIPRRPPSKTSLTSKKQIRERLHHLKDQKTLPQNNLTLRNLLENLLHPVPMKTLP